jgi:hypothetical protein
MLREQQAVPLNGVALWEAAHVAVPLLLTQYVPAQARALTNIKNKNVIANSNLFFIAFSFINLE